MIFPDTYQNPLYNQYFADPFILSYESKFYAYGTSPKRINGKPFPVLVSSDLVHWEQSNCALIPPEGADDFWAPEVVFSNGIFYLYYSAHGIKGKSYQIRLATSKHPLGPFVDDGKAIIPDCPFTIDPHPFQDSNGQWYLFYAKDFLETENGFKIGTGIVVDRLIKMNEVEGNPSLVIRPFAEWQLFMSQRMMYSKQYDWYTVEAPAVRFHNKHYYCFYSGGSWEKDNYGISYVVSETILGPYKFEGLDQPILKTVKDTVIGPGHNSFITISSGQEYVVYHAWDPSQTARLMCMDRLTWEGNIPIITGPTWTLQKIY